jgi:hypothetical protein
MASEWYWAVKGKKTGPFSAEQLRPLAAVGQLQPTDMLLLDGSSKWVAAGTVADIFPAAAGVPAARPVPVAAPPPPQAVPARPTAAPPAANGPPPAEGFSQKALDLARSLGRTGGEILEEVKTMNKRLAAVAAAIPVLVGPVGDFLTPVLSLNRNVFLVALFGVVVLIVAFHRRDRLLAGLRVTRRTLAIACIFCGILMAGFGGWWVLGWIEGNGNRGFLASNVGFMGKLQSAVLGNESPDGRKDDGRQVDGHPR